MTAEHELVHRVLDAQSDPEAADGLVRDYLPFIRAEAARFLKRPPAEGEDALGIAMRAFYEAAMAYQRRRGPFLRLAAAAIRNRLIDAYRRERRHRGQASLDQPVGDGDTTLGERLAGGDDHLGQLVHAEAAREEIAHYAGQLAALGLSLSDVADSCPRQERTLRACMAALAWARENPAVLEQAVATGKLPLARMADGAGVERKTLERHRRYLLAILLAYTNGFEVIRGHLRQLDPEGRRAV